MQPVIKCETSSFEQVKHIQMKTNGAYLISLKSGNEKSALWRNHVLPDLDDRPVRVPQIRTGSRLEVFISEGRLGLSACWHVHYPCHFKQSDLWKGAPCCDTVMGCWMTVKVHTAEGAVGSSFVQLTSRHFLAPAPGESWLLGSRSPHCVSGSQCAVGAWGMWAAVGVWWPSKPAGPRAILGSHRLVPSGPGTQGQTGTSGCYRRSFPADSRSHFASGWPFPRVRGFLGVAPPSTQGRVSSGSVPISSGGRRWQGIQFCVPQRCPDEQSQPWLCFRMPLELHESLTPGPCLRPVPQTLCWWVAPLVYKTTDCESWELSVLPTVSRGIWGPWCFLHPGSAPATGLPGPVSLSLCCLGVHLQVWEAAKCQPRGMGEEVASAHGSSLVWFLENDGE